MGVRSISPTPDDNPFSFPKEQKTTAKNAVVFCYVSRGTSLGIYSNINKFCFTWNIVF